MPVVTATRYHDISTGHRVVGHENKCRHLHGHNYRIHFTCHADKGLDHIGRVIDFGVIKEKLCMWLEENWDHKFLAWEHDPVMKRVDAALDDHCKLDHDYSSLITMEQSVVWTPFNPTAENMAQFLVEVVGPMQLAGTGVTLVCVDIEETAKCGATYSL